MKLVRVLEIDRRDAANALGVNVGGHDALAEGQRGKNGKFRPRVEAVDIGGRIGFGVAGLLRLRQHLIETGRAPFDLREDVIAGAVENAVKRLNAVSRNAFAQHGVNGDASSDARLHRQVDAGSDGAIPDFGAAQAINSLFAVTTDFPWAVAASMISRATPVPPINSAIT